LLVSGQQPFDLAPRRARPILRVGEGRLPTGEAEHLSFSEFPAVQEPEVVQGARMRYEGGRVVEASATSNEEALMRALDIGEGARVLGEFWIGCNPGIQ
jgi:aminopeptidase